MQTFPVKMKNTTKSKDFILYEDNHIIIVNKPSKILVQGDKTGDTTLIDLVKKYIKTKYNKPGNVFLGLPHRIDRPTSGIVILCRTSKSLSRISGIFREKKIKKIYWAIVQNKIQSDSGSLIHFLKKNKKINKSIVSNKEKNQYLKAELKYKLHKSLDNGFIYEIEIITGRHHQIRAQISHIGSPIKGDVKYGFNKTNTDGSICLHARQVEFIHPIKNIKLNIKAPTPTNDKIWESCTI